MLEPVAYLLEQHLEKSGVYALQNGLDAFAALGLLAEETAQSIDAQYYIWHKDSRGLLLLQTLRDAADRGVSNRLSIDDFGINGELERKGVEVRILGGPSGARDELLLIATAQSLRKLVKQSRWQPDKQIQPHPARNRKQYQSENRASFSTQSPH
ncbi:hypothetical protein [Tritonibacter scottomollicae]|uniref:hypothetical protein n=1 Tax=Tritonibacter scottomollicae TaxID=483013 RepID=UPI003AA9BB5D